MGTSTRPQRFARVLGLRRWTLARPMDKHASPRPRTQSARRGSRPTTPNNAAPSVNAQRIVTARFQAARVANRDVIVAFGMTRSSSASLRPARLVVPVRRSRPSWTMAPRSLVSEAGRCSRIFKNVPARQHARATASASARTTICFKLGSKRVRNVSRRPASQCLMRA